MARIYATLNPSALGQYLELEDGGLVATINTGNQTMSRLARATVPAITGRRYFEAVFYGDGALLDCAAVGIVRSTHSLSKYVGEELSGFGLLPGNGAVHNDGGEVVDVPLIEKRMYIGVLVDMGALSCTWFVNGSAVAAVAITNSFWYPAVSVAAGSAYGLRCYVNFGQYAFEYPQRGTADNTGPYVQGWFTETATPEQLRFCPARRPAFHTGPSDALPLVSFDNRILNAEQFNFSTKCQIWTGGTTAAGTAFSSFDIDNGDGRYDGIAGEDRRDQIATCIRIPAGGTYSDGVVVATAVVDSVRPVGETALRITLKDFASTLERAFQRRRMPPWADDGVANTPVPVSLGANRNVAPPLEDAVNRVYRLHDAPITNIVAVRDNGAPLDVHASPPQYAPTLRADAIALQTDAVGLLTVDISSQGDQVVIPGAADILGGAGLFTTWPNPAAPPPGWVSGGTVTTLVRQGIAQGQPQDYVIALDSTNSYNPQAGRYGAWIRYDTANLLPGKTYRIQFRLKSTYGPGPGVDNGMQRGLMVRTDLTNLSTGAVSPHMQPLQDPLYGPNSYTFVYTVPPGAARNLYFIACASRGVTGAGVGIGDAVWYGVQVELLGQVTAALPLQGITLYDYLREVFARAGVPDDRWVSEDARILDSVTGYSGGEHIADTKTVRQVAQLPLDSYGAVMLQDRLGRYRFRRLADPTLVADEDLVAVFDDGDVKGGVDWVPDLAPGLTAMMGARRNNRVFTENDFVSDTLEVPMAMRTQWMRDAQFVEPFAGTLSPSYQFAAQAPPLVAWFDDRAMAQREIARMCAPYTAGRRRADGSQITTTPRFITFEVQYSTLAPPELLFGDAIKLTYRRHRLQNGQKMAVFDTTVFPEAKRIVITAWSPE